MDEFDIKILRELTHGSHEGLAWGEIAPSYRTLGMKLGISRDAVRTRLERMSKTGFIRVFPVQVNPTLLGLKMGAVELDVPSDFPKGGLVAKISLIDGVILIARHVGGLVGLTFYYADEDDRDRKIKLVEAICGAAKARFTEIPFPPCNVKLSSNDWKILATLQRRRTETAGEIARELGVSSRTLKRRTKRMIDGMAMATLVSSDVSALRGAVIGNLQVRYSPNSSRPETDRALLDGLDRCLVYAGLWTDFSLFTLVLSSIPEASEILEMVKRTKGVANARLDLIDERIEVYSTLRTQVERKLSYMIAASSVRRTAGRDRDVGG